MIPIFYRGMRLNTFEYAARTLHTRTEKVHDIIERLLNDEVIFMHGHRIFLDEEAVAVKLHRVEVARKANHVIKKMRKERQAKKHLLLAPGYCTHWLGVYHG